MLVLTHGHDWGSPMTFLNPSCSARWISRTTSNQAHASAAWTSGSFPKEMATLIYFEQIIWSYYIILYIYICIYIILYSTVHNMCMILIYIIYTIYNNIYQYIYIYIYTPSQWFALKLSDGLVWKNGLYQNGIITDDSPSIFHDKRRDNSPYRLIDFSFLLRFAI